MHMNIKRSVRGYVRDTYINSKATLNPSLHPINCAMGSSQWGMSAMADEAHRAFSASDLTNYCDPFHEHLVDKIYARFQVSREQVSLFLGHGSFNLADRLMHKFISPEIMIGAGPQFNEIPSEFVAAGGAYVPVAFGEYEFPTAAIKEMIGVKTSIVYIDNPNNPTGRLVSLDTITEIAETAMQSGTLVLVDEAYGDFVDDSCSAVHLVPAFENIIVIRSFSKALGLAAARVGYMFMPRQLAMYYRNLDVPFEPSLHSALLASATLEDPLFIEHVRKSAARSKQALIPVLEQQGLSVLPTHPQTSILSVRLNGSNVVDAFASISVSVEPGSAFKQTNDTWDDSYCRIRIPHEENLTELIDRIKTLKLSDRSA
jgi:histidinol-phosphate aminotransferase